MAQASYIDAGGDDTGANDGVREESVRRDGEAVEPESSNAVRADTSSRRSSISSTATASTAVEPGDRKNKEGSHGGKIKGGRDKAKGRRLSRSERSSSKSAAIFEALAGEVDKRAALPSTERSDAKSTRSRMAQTEENGVKNNEDHRRISSKTRASSNILSSTVSARKPTKTSNRRRTRSSSSHSPDVVEAQGQGQETIAAYNAHVPPSAPDSKRRKRSRSSRTLSVDGDPAEPAERTPPMMQQSKIHSDGTTAERALYCPNATSSNTENKCNDTLSNTEAVAILAAGPKPAARGEGSEYPAEVVNQCKNSTIGKESRRRTGEGGGIARRHSGRQCGDEATQEIVERKGKSDLTEGGVSRRHSTGSSSGERTRGKRTARAAMGAAVDPSPSPALGLKVIDKGATKQLVLTADETTAGRVNLGRSGEGSRVATETFTGGDCREDRSRLTKSLDVVYSQHEGQSLLHERCQSPPNLGEEERSRAFRDNFAKALLATGGNDTTRRVRYQQPTTAGQPPPVEAANKQHPEPTHQNHRDPFEHSRKEKVSASTDTACTLSPTDSQRIAPSFSVVLTDNNALNNNSISINPTPPTTSTSSSSFLGSRDNERTAKYVPEQASFHADITNDDINLDSPLGEERGDVEEDEAVNGDPLSITSNSGIGVVSSRPPAESYSCSSVSTVEDSRPEIRNEKENDPAVMSLRQAPAIPERNNQNGRENDLLEVPTNAPRRTRAIATPETATGPERASRPAAKRQTELATSLSTPSTVLQESSLAGEGANARLDPSQQQHLERGVTQDHAEFTRRSKGLIGRYAEDGGGLAGDLVHFRTDASRHLVCGEQPAMFFLRPNESLGVTRIEGAGRLLVTLREEAGAAANVVIDGATVHDSAAHFGHVAVQVGLTFHARCA